MLKYLEHRIDKRKKIIRPYRAKWLATNIEEYNKVSGHKMSYIMLMNDEFPGIIPDNSDKGKEKDTKQECLDIIKKLSKAGREMGIFVINGVQKTVKDELPPIIKSMSAVRISLRANDEISSQVIMGDNSAVGLADRYAVYSLNGGADKDYLFMPELTTQHMNELLKPYIDYKRKNCSLEINDTVDTEPAKVYPIPKRGAEKPKDDNATGYESFNSKKGYEVVNGD
jgi:DNA segregation ATPase FtsK/SpoIIIE-like protein